jgi:hypothetical protein
MIMISKKEKIGDLFNFLGLALIFLGIISLFMHVYYNFNTPTKLIAYMNLEYFLPGVILVLIGRFFLAIKSYLDK